MTIPGGLERGNWFARVIGTAARLPGSGPIVARDGESTRFTSRAARAGSPTTTR